MDGHVIQGVQLLHLYKPPPPYPINRPSSNSTPDLASQTLSQPTRTFISGQVIVLFSYFVIIPNIKFFSVCLLIRINKNTVISVISIKFLNMKISFPKSRINMLLLLYAKILDIMRMTEICQ